jgi:hypothetical protein
LVTGTTTPWLADGLEEVRPTASQVVVLEQATAVSLAVPGTTTALPGTPLVTGTTTPCSPPWPSGFKPTATQVVVVGQATPFNRAVPATGWTVALAAAALPSTPAGTASADTTITAASRDRRDPADRPFCTPRRHHPPARCASPLIIVGTLPPGHIPLHTDEWCEDASPPPLCQQASVERLTHGDGKQILPARPRVGHPHLA